MSFKVCVNALSLFGKYHLRDIFVFPLGCLLLQLPLEVGGGGQVAAVGLLVGKKGLKIVLEIPS